MRPYMKRVQLKSQCGQALIVVGLTLPLFFIIAAVVVDGSISFVHKRQMQNAADAAALSAARELTPALPGNPCDSACMAAVRTNVAAKVTEYGRLNNSPAAANPIPQCTQPSDTDCYTWPYGTGPNANAKVEVRFRSVVHLSFASVGGFAPDFLKASARAVASATGATVTHCVFNPPLAAGIDPDQYLPTNCVIPGHPAETGTYQAATAARCEFNPPLANPDQYLTTTPPCTGPLTGGVNGATALVMSRECDAISYTGAGGGTVGSLVTNGGIWFQGNAPKRVNQLAYDQPGCPGHPDHPPSGTSQCDASGNFLCAKELFDFSDRMPMNWPIPPPPEPSPVAAGAWNPTSDYPSKCIDLGTGDVTFAAGSGAPGIYCLRGGGKLTLGGDLSTGDGYTFFALGGGQIQVSSNGTKVKFYWPSACGARPTGRPATFTCFGRTISGYDPQTLFYATSTVHDSQCDKNSICISGGSSSVEGDMFAVAPAVFPPPDRSP
jgi:hypothetical protein